MLPNMFKLTLQIILLLILLMPAISTKDSINNHQNKQEINKRVSNPASETWKMLIDSAQKEHIKHYSDFMKTRKHTPKKGYFPKEGFVPDEKTAIKIAEAVWFPIYGDKIYNGMPFIAMLMNNNVWRVFGILPPGWNGSCPFAEIRKSDGKIIQVFFG